ncbi:MAG TPA: rhomboid family intramembrane serine protease [Gallionellaceae bacterium]
MSLEFIIIIVAFIAGGMAVSYFQARSAEKQEPSGHAAPEAQPPEQFPPQQPHTEQRAQPAAERASNDWALASSGLASIPVTLALIAACILIALLSNLGQSREVLDPLYIADPDSPGFGAILGGELWRLITPAFIHFGVMHLAFNMIWLWDLGGLLERKKGHLSLLGLVLAIGIAANLAQYIITASPYFGGMSGVVYGLLGYVWMHGRVNPRFGVILSQQTVVIMLAWFVLCWLGMLGPIANWAHTAGLAMGVALGARKPDRAG